jgi:hypothetical protein
MSGERVGVLSIWKGVSTMVARLLRRLTCVRWPRGLRRAQSRQDEAIDVYDQALSLQAARRLRDLDRITRLGEW